MENVHPAGVMVVSYLSERLPTLLLKIPLSETGKRRLFQKQIEII